MDPFGCHRLPLGRLWRPLGPLWGALGATWDPVRSVGEPLKPRGTPLGPCGIPLETTWGVPETHFCPKCSPRPIFYHFVTNTLRFHVFLQQLLPLKTPLMVVLSQQNATCLNVRFLCFSKHDFIVFGKLSFCPDGTPCFAKTRLPITSILLSSPMPAIKRWPPGICPRRPRGPRSPRSPRKWCQKVLLRPPFHTRRGLG